MHRSGGVIGVVDRTHVVFIVLVATLAGTLSSFVVAAALDLPLRKAGFVAAALVSPVIEESLRWLVARGAFESGGISRLKSRLIGFLAAICVFEIVGGILVLGLPKVTPTFFAIALFFLAKTPPVLMHALNTYIVLVGAPMRADRRWIAFALAVACHLILNIVLVPVFARMIMSIAPPHP